MTTIDGLDLPRAVNVGGHIELKRGGVTYRTDKHPPWKPFTVLSSSGRHANGVLLEMHCGCDGTYPYVLFIDGRCHVLGKHFGDIPENGCVFEQGLWMYGHGLLDYHESVVIAIGEYTGTKPKRQLNYKVIAMDTPKQEFVIEIIPNAENSIVYQLRVTLPAWGPRAQVIQRVK